MHSFISCLVLLYSTSISQADNVTQVTNVSEVSNTTQAPNVTQEYEVPQNTTVQPEETSSVKADEHITQTNDAPEYYGSVNTIAAGLISVLSFNEDLSNSSRMIELTDKLKTIAGYVIDKENYATILLKEAKNSDLTATNFYKSLSDDDHFQFKKADDKCLYVTLKERMNRDDVLKILADNGKKKMRKSARRMMSNDFVPKDKLEKRMEEAVDDFFAQKSSDNHKFGAEDSFSKYWDPQTELKELDQHQRHSGRRLFRGERTTVRHYPFMVSVHVMGRFWCGGVIYWHDIIITSASCLQLLHNNRFFRENPKTLDVRVGSNHSRIGGEMVEALEVYFNPSYNPRTLEGNIALIRLRRRLIINYHTVPKLIAISHQDTAVPATGEVLLLGWGVTKTSQKMAYEPIFLQRKLLPVYPNNFCKEVYGKNFINSRMFCAGTMTTGEGACDHDAGGPAIMAGRLVGVISFGPTICGYPNVPTVFTLVGAYADWIETVNESMPSYYRGKQRTTLTTPFTYPELPTFSTPKPTTPPTPASARNLLRAGRHRQTPAEPPAQMLKSLPRKVQKHELKSAPLNLYNDRSGPELYDQPSVHL